MIFKKINRWFNKNNLDYISIKYTNLKSNEYNTVYEKIFYDKIDYILVEDFFTEQELMIIREKIQLCTESNRHLVDYKDNGYTLGKTLFDSNNMDKYKELVAFYEQISEEIFGCSIKNKIIELLHKLSTITYIHPASFDDDKAYVSNTVRVMQPQKGGLFVHSDLDIHNSFKESEHILSIINPTTVLSVFIMLQNAEIGGNLFVYNKKYNETPGSVYKDADKFNAIKKYLSKYSKNKIHIPSGALILFNAGQRWHAIEQIDGNKSRITLGCFTSYTKNNKEILIWS